jgi:UDP-N-acetylmuramoyl-tripeptide--D-alanyl-D-alanine ligase
MTLELAEIARLLQAHGSFRPAVVSGWSVDTRTLRAGDLYFALRGPNHDGHDYAARALELGAAAVVVEHSMGLPSELIVPDALRAMAGIAAYARHKWGGRIVAVTGSAGKTTTKDAIASLLGAALEVGKTSGNFNNNVGVPLSLLRLPERCRVGVIEIGMNHAGEIRELAQIAAPDVAVVTNVGHAHAEFFDSIEGIAAAKRELVEALPVSGVAVLNADDPRVSAMRAAHAGRSVLFGVSERADVRAKAVEMSAEGIRFSVDGVRLESALRGAHNLSNLLAALAVARVFEIPLENLSAPVRAFSPGDMRGERSTHRGITVWNDCYNSNPDAARAMLDVLAATPARRRIAILGEMLELGQASPELHAGVGRHAARLGVDTLAGVSGHAREMVDAAAAAGLEALFFEDAAAAGEWARGAVREGDAVLFKGSRGVRMERAFERFLA